MTKKLTMVSRHPEEVVIISRATFGDDGRSTLEIMVEREYMRGESIILRDEEGHELPCVLSEIRRLNDQFVLTLRCLTDTGFFPPVE